MEGISTHVLKLRQPIEKNIWSTHRLELVEQGHRVVLIAVKYEPHEIMSEKTKEKVDRFLLAYIDKYNTKQSITKEQLINLFVNVTRYSAVTSIVSESKKRKNPEANQTQFLEKLDPLLKKHGLGVMCDEGPKRKPRLMKRDVVETVVSKTYISECIRLLVSGEEILVDKVFLLGRSSYFSVMMTPSASQLVPEKGVIIKPSAVYTKETRQSIIELKGIDPGLFKSLLYYSKNYTLPPDFDRKNQFIDLYQMAKQFQFVYSIRRLEQEIVKEMDITHWSWDTLLQYVELWKECASEKILEKCIEYFAVQFITAFKHAVINNNNNPMKNLKSKVYQKNLIYQKDECLPQVLCQSIMTYFDEMLYASNRLVCHPGSYMQSEDFPGVAKTVSTHPDVITSLSEVLKYDKIKRPTPSRSEVFHMRMCLAFVFYKYIKSLDIENLKAEEPLVTLEVMPNLVRVDMSSLKGLDDDTLEAILSKCPNITSLCLSGCKDLIADQQLTHILTSLTHIVELDVSSCPWLNDDFLIQILKKMPHLTHINVGDTPVSNIGIYKILRLCPDIQKIELEDTAVDDDLVDILIRAEEKRVARLKESKGDQELLVVVPIELCIVKSSFSADELFKLKGSYTVVFGQEEVEDGEVAVV